MGKKKRGAKKKDAKKKDSKQKGALKSTPATPEVARKDLLTRFKELNPDFPKNPKLSNFLQAIEESAQSLVQEVTDYEMSLKKPDDFPKFSSILPFIEKLESLILKFQITIQSTKSFRKSEIYQRLGVLLHEAITEAYTRSTDAVRSQEDEIIDLHLLGDGKKVSDEELKSILTMSLGLGQDQPITQQVRVLNYWPLLPLFKLHSIALKHAFQDQKSMLRFITKMINTEIRRGANLEIFQYILESERLDFDNIFTVTQDWDTVPLIEFMIYLSTTISKEECIIKKPDEFFKILDFVMEKISDEAIRECKDGKGEKILAKLIKLHVHISAPGGKEDDTYLLEKYIMIIANKTMNQVDAIVLQIPDEDSLPAATRSLIAQINSKKSTALTKVVQNMGMDPKLTSAQIEQSLREGSRAYQAGSKAVKATTKDVEVGEIEVAAAIKIQQAFRNWRKKIKPLAPKEQEARPVEALRKAYHNNKEVLARYQEYNESLSKLEHLHQEASSLNATFQDDVAAVLKGTKPEEFDQPESYQYLLREAAATVSLQQEKVDSYTKLLQEYYQTLLSAAQGCKTLSRDEEVIIAHLYDNAIKGNNMSAFQAMNETGLCNCTNKFGYNPIYLAALSERPDLVNQLLSYGAELDIEVRDEFDRDCGVVSQLVRSSDQGSSVFRALIAGGVNPEELISLAIDDDCSPKEAEIINIIASKFGYQSVDIAEKMLQTQSEKYEEFQQSHLAKLFTQCSDLSDQEQKLQLFRDNSVEAEPGGIIDALLKNGINAKENQNAEGFFKVIRGCGFKIPYEHEKQKFVDKEVANEVESRFLEYGADPLQIKPSSSLETEPRVEKLARHSQGLSPSHM